MHCKMRSQCASTALVKKRPRADRAKAVVEICRHFAQPRANSQNTAIYWKKRTLSSFLFGTAKMEPKDRIFQIIFELWNSMIVWGITNSGEFLLNPPQLSRRLNRYSIRLTFLPETLPNCHKRFTISLLEIHWLSVSGVAFPFSRDFEISWSSLLLVILSGSVAQVCGSGRTWRTAPLVKDSE